MDRGPASPGAYLKGRVWAPMGVELEVAPLLIGTSGKAYKLNRSAGGTEIGGNGTICDLNTGFPVIDEPIAAIRLELVVKAQPEKLFAFRMTDIPLPPERPFVPVQVDPRAAPAGAAAKPGRAEESPFHDPAGGMLISPVRIAGKPAPEGRLSIGLAIKTGTEWGGIRWIDSGVDGQGAARLEALRPGTYRILRSYRPNKAIQGEGSGRWLDGEITAVVTAGKATVLPPLRWKWSASPKTSPRPPNSGVSRGRNRP